MTRQEAEAMVAPHVQTFLAYKFDDVGDDTVEFTGEPPTRYQGIQHAAANELLGEAKYRQLLQDPIRKIGPNKLTVYPWNVVDYLVKD